MLHTISQSHQSNGSVEENFKNDKKYFDLSYLQNFMYLTTVYTSESVNSGLTFHPQRDGTSVLSLIRKTREAGDRFCYSWIGSQGCYTLYYHHSNSIYQFLGQNLQQFP